MSTDASGFDQYQRVGIQGVSSADDSTPTNVHVDPTTNETLVKLQTPDGDSVMDDTNDSVKVTISADSVGIGGGTQYAEDTQHNSGDTGTMALAVRNDTLAALATTDGDYAPLQVNASGALYTIIDNDVVDSGNSTTSTLTANTDYTGTGVDLLGYSGITVTVFADQDSDANGMRFEFSSDNTNWDVSKTFDYKASTGREFQFACEARYFRVAFQNAGTNQTAFRLQTVLHRRPVALTTIHRADADIAVDRSATLVKSIIMAQAGGTGDFTPIQATTGGNLKISLEEASDGMDIGAGNAGSETLRVSVSTDDVNLSAINTAVTELAGAVNGSQYDVDIKASDLDLMLGTDFSAVFGTSSLVTATQADNIVNTTNGVNTTSFLYGFDGTTWDRLRGDSTNGLLVNLGSNNDVTVTGSLTSAGNVTNAGTFAVQVDAALPSGTNAIGKLAANSGVDIGDVDVTSISAGSNLIGDVGISGARTSGGTTPYKNLDVDETEDQVKATAGQVYWIHAINTTDAPLYLKFYNATAASVTVGSTTPTLTFPVPGNANSDGAGFNLSIPNGIAFSTAITIAATTAVADNDTGAPGANALIVNLGYA